MHIPDGVASVPVLAGGGVVTAAALAFALPRIDAAALPRVAVVSAAFFVVSLISIPIGPSSVHLVLAALTGFVLGWGAVPALFVALLLQAVFFGFGGITALGLTTAIAALPGVLWSGVFRRTVTHAASPSLRGVAGGAAAALSIASTGLLVVLVLVLSDPAYLGSAPFILAGYLPLVIAEALITCFAVIFLSRVMPEALSPVRVVPGHG